jgi:protein TonB
MSDTVNPRSTGMPPEDRPPGEVASSRTSSTLVWVLVLVALIALLWWFYGLRTPATDEGVTAPATTAEPATPAPDMDADRARAATPAPAAAPAQRAAPPVTRAVALLERPAASYPPEAYRAREEGRVLVNVQVNASGSVTGATIAERSGSQILDRAALEQVRQWKFSPALENGKPIASSIEVPVAYSLDEG